MSTSEVFLVAMTLIFAVPYLIWRCFRTDYYAPLVVVQILTGILLGPGLMGAAFPEYYRFIFTPTVVQALNGVAWWAVMLYVFIAGIELDLGKTWEHRRESLLTAGLALGMPLLFGCIAALAIVHFAGWIGARARSWQFVLGIGMACAVTALPILILLMEKLEVLRRPLGQRMLRYASLDDVAIWGVLALILHGLATSRASGRLSRRVRRRGVSLPGVDAAPAGERPLVRRPHLARAVRARRRLVRPALHGRGFPRRCRSWTATGSTRRAWTSCAITCSLS